MNNYTIEIAFEKSLRVIKHCLLVTLFAMSGNSFAQFATIEVGDGVLPPYATTATTQTPFTTINFDRTFESPPNVFVMTPEFGAGAANDPCTIRIRAITETSFDASCIEPLSEDRDSPGTTFEYIAIQNGGVTVPLADGTGNVQFRSQCNFVTAQQHKNCAGCGAEGYLTVGLAPAFTNAPALLTQIQSTNNTVNGSATTPGGEPIFLDTAVRRVFAGSFDVAIERMEAGVSGALSNGETICYLAVERDGCQELNFSTLGGPTSVDFQALFGGNVDGHDNGCSAGEGVSFAPGCFTTTPITLAKQRTHAGADGGFLRRCSVNAATAIFTYDEDRVSDAERAHIDEQISALAFSSLFSTPVTLSNAEVSRRGRRAVFEWQTSAETFHLGFHLWGQTNDGWIQLNRKLIAGQNADTADTSSYKHSITLSREQQNEISNFGISTVDNTGYEEFFGPFTENQRYGEQSNSEPVDWTETRNNFEASMHQQGYVKTKKRWRKTSSYKRKRLQRRKEKAQLGINSAMFDLSFEGTGIHRISASELLNANPSWNGIKLSNIALTLNGHATPRHIISDDDVLDSNDHIMLNVIGPRGTDRVYLQNYHYRLSLDPSKAISASVFDGRNVDEAELDNHALNTQLLTSRKLHSPAITSGDPWYDTRLLAINQPTSKVYQFDFSNPISLEHAGNVYIDLFGGIDLPEDNDHHAQIWLNGTLIEDAVFDGLNRYSKTINLTPGLLKQTGNKLTVTIVGDTGYIADLVLIDELRVSPPTRLSTQQLGAFQGSASAAGYQISLAPNSPDVEVYAHTTTGALSFIQPLINDNTVEFISLPYQQNSNAEAELSYSVSGRAAWPSATNISIVNGANLHNLETDFLIIAHPAFMGEDLNQFIDYKNSQGFQTNVVNWLDIVTTYGYGNNTPAALSHYLRKVNQDHVTPNVLIVGGHTYDYFGVVDEDTINFIPAPYRRVSVFEYTPTDNPYADLNADNIPEIAIGRWPVRSLDDLRTIIKKTKDWVSNRESSQYQDALLIGQAIDSQQLNFNEQLAGRAKLPLASTDGIDNIKQLDLEQIFNSAVENPVSEARRLINESINDGADVLSFAGHGSPVSWGFQGIINTEFINSLTNAGEPLLLVPLACYVTYYESVSTNSLAHQWLFAGDKGAAAIHGASVLGNYRENGIFAERYLKHAQTEMTLGDAILKTKQSMSSPNQMLHNWTLLGDPTLPLR